MIYYNNLFYLVHIFFEITFWIQNQGNAHVPVNQGCVNADGTLRFYEVCYFFMSVSHEIWFLNQHRLTCQKTKFNFKKRFQLKRIKLTDNEKFSACSVNFVALAFLVKWNVKSLKVMKIKYIKITKRVKRNKINKISKKCWTYWQRELQFLQCQLCRLG